MTREDFFKEVQSLRITVKDLPFEIPLDIVLDEQRQTVYLFDGHTLVKQYNKECWIEIPIYPMISCEIEFLLNHFYSLCTALNKYSGEKFLIYTKDMAGFVLIEE